MDPAELILQPKLPGVLQYNTADVQEGSYRARGMLWINPIYLIFERENAATFQVCVCVCVCMCVYICVCACVRVSPPSLCLPLCLPPLSLPLSLPLPQTLFFSPAWQILHTEVEAVDLKAAPTQGTMMIVKLKTFRQLFFWVPVDSHAKAAAQSIISLSCPGAVHSATCLK